MSPRPQRLRSEGRASQPNPEHVATFRRHFWLIAALSACLVLAAIVTYWLRQTAGIVWPGAGSRSDATTKQAATTLSRPTLSPTSTAEEIMEELRRVADRLAKSFPDEANALDVLARVEFSLGHRPEAMEIWRRCTELNPDDASAYFAAMAIVAANSGDSEEAAQLCRKAIELGSRDPQVPLLLADNLMKAGKVEEAVAALENQVQSGTFSAAILTTLGQAYLELDLPEKAKTVFHSAIEAAPNDTATLYGLARAYAKLGQKSRAASYLEQFSILDAQESSSYTEGVRTFNDDVSTRQVALRALIDAARCYQTHQQLDNAEQLLVNAAALAPDDVESRAVLMTLYEQTGRDQKALEICEQLRLIDPKNGDYWLNVGVLSARLGKIDEGLAALRHALQLDPHNRRYREVYDTIAREK